VGFDSNGKVQVKYITADKNKKLTGGPLKVLPSKYNAGITAFFIKPYMLVSAAGHASNPVYVIADMTMNEEEIAVHEVKGLSIPNGLNSTGWVVMCKTRGCNLEFFITDTRLHYDLPLDSVAWFQLDGEAIQIKCYEDPELLAELAAVNTVVGNPSGSTSEDTQALDKGDVFKGPKTKNKNISDRDVEGDPRMLGAVDAMLKEHVVEQKAKRINEQLVTQGLAPLNASVAASSADDSEDEDQEAGDEVDDTWTDEDIAERNSMLNALNVKTLKAGHKKMAKYGLARVNLALQITIKKDMIVKSFNYCGICPFDEDKMLSNCKASIGYTEVCQIKAELPALAGIYAYQDELFDENFDRHNIRNNMNSSKDGKANPRNRRSVILNGASHLQRCLARKENDTMMKEDKQSQKVNNKVWRKEYAADAKAKAKEDKENKAREDKENKAREDKENKAREQIRKKEEKSRRRRITRRRTRCRRSRRGV
jgi:hypothetical protein